MERIKDIPTGKLTVDTSNFRIGEQASVRDAYLAMIDEQRDNLVNLADDIITRGLSPADPFIVCPDPENPSAFIVCEGNRRLTSIRILETPALAADTDFHKRFLGLSPGYKKNPIRKIPCVVMKDKEAAFEWIERKHLAMDGRGVAQWNSPATGRAKAFRGKVRPSIAIVDYLKASKSLSKPLETSLLKRTTNIDRVFQMPYVKSALGVSIEKDGEITFASGDTKKGNKLLHKMMEALAAPAFTVDKIKHESDRKDFIDRFSSDNVLDTQSGGKKPSGAKKVSSSKRGGKTAPSPLDRKTLAMGGRDFALHVTEPRLNALYSEALLLNPDKLPNSAAIMTRVFLELATDHFLTVKKIPFPSKHAGKKNWADIGIKLNEKMEAALRVIDPAYNAVKFKEVRKGISGNAQEVLHSIEALHEVMHALSADRDPKEVKRIWTRWQPYLEAIFDNLSVSP